MSNSISAILTRLRLRFRRPNPSPPDRPILGLNPEDLEHLERLVQTPGWRAYLKALEWVFHSEAEAYLGGLGHDDYLKKIGLLAGFRRAASLPDELVATYHRQEQAKHDRTAAERDAQSTVASRFIGTAAFRGARTDRMAGS